MRVRPSNPFSLSLRQKEGGWLVRLTCDNHGACHGARGASDGGKVDVHCVDDALEVEGHLDIEQLSGDEQPHAQADPEAGAHVVLGPQVARHFLDNGPVGLALLLGGEELLLQQRVGLWRRCFGGDGAIGNDGFSVQRRRGEEAGGRVEGQARGMAEG